MSKSFVQRYSPRYAHNIVQMKDGSFVTYEAYEALTKQRDALLDACKTGLAYVYAIISKVPRSIQDLREDKEQLEAAIKLCERK